MPRWLLGSLLLLAGLVLLAWLGLLFIRADRGDLQAAGVPLAAEAMGQPEVALTWLGVTSLLFDDGETQLLTDGFFSRPGLLDLVLDRDVTSDQATIERVLAEEGITRLAALLTVHSHYDHAMDVAEVARRTGARVLGSESTANLARGGGLPESQIVVMGPGRIERFGRFSVEFIPSRHMPASEDGSPPFPGSIDGPLSLPAPISAMREGGSFSIVIRHPGGSALVQGSAGFVPGALDARSVDAVLLGIGGLGRLPPSHVEAYWHEIVGRTRPTRVYPIHWDDFTLPYGDLRPAPRLVYDVEASLSLVARLAADEPEPPTVELLPFRKRVRLF